MNYSDISTKHLLNELLKRDDFIECLQKRTDIIQKVIKIDDVCKYNLIIKPDTCFREFKIFQKGACFYGKSYVIIIKDQMD